MTADDYPSEDNHEFILNNITLEVVSSFHLRLVSRVFHKLSQDIDVTRLNELIYESLPEHHGGDLLHLQTLLAVYESYSLLVDIFELSAEQKRELVEMLWADGFSPEDEMTFQVSTLEAKHVMLGRRIALLAFGSMITQEMLTEED